MKRTLVSTLVGRPRRIAAEPLPPGAPAETEIDLGDGPRQLIAASLSPTPVNVDEIIRTCQLSPAVVTTILLEWELAGQLERHPGNRVSLIVSGSERA